MERGRYALAVDRVHSLVANGQFLTAFREVERLVMDPKLEDELKAPLFVLGVRAAAGLREIYAAAKMAEKAIEWAELGCNWEHIGNARLHSALIYRELGDTAQSLRFFHLFFLHLDRYPALQVKTAHAYYNQGLTHQQRREYAEALYCYGCASERFEELEHHTGLLACLQNSAWTLLLQQLPMEAEPFLRRSEALSARLEVPEYQVTQLVIEALHARQMREPERATALCEEVFQPGRVGKSERHSAEAAWIMADLTLEADRLKEAAIFADLAVTYALEAKEPHLMNLASEVRQRVHSRRNRLPA